MRDGFSVSASRVEGFEGFREAVLGSHVDVMQLEPGRLRGSLTHIGTGNLSLSVGAFSVGIRAQRISTEPELIIGMLLGSENRVTHWSYDMHPGDVLVIPPSVEHDGRFYGASSYAALRLDLADVASIFGGEARMSDAMTWNRKNHYRADPRLGKLVVRKLCRIVARLADPETSVSRDAVNFWQRSMVDAVTASVMYSTNPEPAEPLPSATRLVRSVEHYVDTAGARPVHISEICAEFGVSRRSLHRAFDEVLSMGPVTFLRRKRLCNIHSDLRAGDPAATTIAEVALQHGFLNLGRFAGYYRALFGEYPSETFGNSSAIRTGYP